MGRACNAGHSILAGDSGRDRSQHPKGGVAIRIVRCIGIDRDRHDGILAADHGHAGAHVVVHIHQSAFRGSAGDLVLKGSSCQCRHPSHAGLHADHACVRVSDSGGHAVRFGSGAWYFCDSDFCHASCGAAD